MSTVLYRPGRSPHWLKVKNPKAPAVKREAEEDWGHSLMTERVDVKNEEGFRPYAEANAAIFKKFRGRYVVRGGKFDAVEGHSRTRNVVIEFPDYASALACYRSPEYQENIKVRLPHSIVDLIVIERYDGPQP